MSHSEQMIENQLIQILSEKENQWTYRPDLKSEEALWQNFRSHLNRINLAVLGEQLLTDKEFNQVKVEFSRLTGTPFLASQWLRGENGVAQILLEREDGKKVTLEAFRNKDISGGTSSYEVVNQVVPDSSRVDRGDATLLINGGSQSFILSSKKSPLKTVSCKLIIKFSVMQKMDFLKVFTQLLKSW